MRISLVGMLGVLTLAGCAATPTSTIGAAREGQEDVPFYRAVSANYGTILAAHRAVSTSASSDGAVDREILAAVGAPPSPHPNSGDAKTEREFIIRVDDGQTLSIVQGATPDLTPGTRVRILRGSDAHIAPLR